MDEQTHVVEMLLEQVGIRASETEIAGLSSAYADVRAAADDLYDVSDAQYEEPAAIFRASVQEGDPGP